MTTAASSKPRVRVKTGHELMGEAVKAADGRDKAVREAVKILRDTMSGASYDAWIWDEAELRQSLSILERAWAICKDKGYLTTAEVWRYANVTEDLKERLRQYRLRAFLRKYAWPVAWTASFILGLTIALACRKAARGAGGDPDCL